MSSPLHVGKFVLSFYVANRKIYSQEEEEEDERGGVSERESEYRERQICSKYLSTFVFQTHEYFAPFSPQLLRWREEVSFDLKCICFAHNKHKHINQTVASLECFQLSI